jgi:dipeptidase E
MTTQQIIAMGGGGFSMEPDNPALDQYVVSQIHKPNPKICFLATASGDAENYVLRFHEAFTKLGCQPSDLSLFRLPTSDLEEFVLEKDAIYVGGGNTRSLLALWREWGLDIILRKAYESGVLLAGISAGANCWFEQSCTDSVPGELGALAGLGFLQGSFCPHYDGEADRRPSYQRLIGEKRILPGYAADDGAALHFVNQQFVRAVSSRPAARVYRVENQDGQAVEEALETRYVGSPS